MTTKSNAEPDTQTGNDVLKNIQINCLLNADLRLSAENERTECSLEELSKCSDQAIAIRILTSKDVNATMKTVHNMKNDYDGVYPGYLCLSYHSFTQWKLKLTQTNKLVLRRILSK